jgi:hypothetical protein
MQKNYLYIAIAIVLTGMISVSTHVLILQYFQAPNINLDPFINQICGYLIRFGTVTASMFIYLYSKEYWINIKPFNRVILFAILILALTESFLRGPVMEVISGAPWMYEILLAIPTYTIYLGLSLIICTFVQAVSEKKQFRFFQYIVLAVLTTVLLYWGVKKIMHYSLVPLLAHVPQPQASANQLPYGMNILIPAYVTYMEPTIATFIVFYLIKDQLSAFNTMTKGFIMAGIIITIHAGVFSILQIASSSGNFLYRVFYYGQFLWEYLALGLLTAYSFDLLRKYQTQPIK